MRLHRRESLSAAQQAVIVLLLATPACKSGIRMVDVPLHARRHGGLSIIEATTEGARARFRPMLMTSIAFMLDVLAIGVGASIGITVSTGMLDSTCLIVLLVPSFFVVQCFEERRKPDVDEAATALLAG